MTRVRAWFSCGAVVPTVALDAPTTICSTEGFLENGIAVDIEWIGDPGPYRYENGSSLRWFMKSRTAHSSFTVSNVSRTQSGGIRKLKAVIKDPRLITPTGKFNVYNTQNDVY